MPGPGRAASWLSPLLPPAQLPRELPQWLSRAWAQGGRQQSHGTDGTWQALVTTLRPHESQMQPLESRRLLCKGDLSPLRKREEQKSIVCLPSSLGPLSPSSITATTTHAPYSPCWKVTFAINLILGHFVNQCHLHLITSVIKGIMQI